MPRIIFKAAFLFALLLPLAALADHCTVSKIALVPGSWENTTTKTSLVLQSQDGAGVSCHVAQTLRFSVLSSDPTGAVTGQSGNALQFYVSSGTSNRNFYYKKGSAATYTLTAKAGYGAADSWTESFSATYSGGSVATTATSSPSAQTGGSAGGNEPPVQNLNEAGSAHYGSGSLSAKRSAPSLNIGAGRDRLGSTGSPMEFRAETDFTYTRNGTLTWNFGDGAEGAGAMVTHVYDYPGEYVVVLNADFPEGRGVARTNVKIIEPKIEITSADESRVEIMNRSSQEASLYGWALVVGARSFLFPKDTIIKPGQNLSFSSKITGLRPAGPNQAALLVLGEVERPKVPERLEAARKERIIYLEKNLAELKTKLALIQPPANLAPTQETVFDSPSMNVAAAAQAVPEPVPGGWLATLKKFFLRTDKAE